MPIVDGSIADDEAGQQEVACKEVGDRQHPIARRGDDDGAEQSLELQTIALPRSDLGNGATPTSSPRRTGVINPTARPSSAVLAISLPLAFIPFLRVSSRHLMMRNETKSALASEPRRSQCQSIALKAPESFSRSSEYTTSARMTTVATSFRIMVRGVRLAKGASPSAMAKLHLELRLGFPYVDRLGHSQHRSLGEGRPRQARRRTGDRELGENHIRRERVFTVAQHIGNARCLAIDVDLPLKREALIGTSYRRHDWLAAVRRLIR